MKIAGVYILEKEVLQYIPVGENYDFARDLFPTLVALGQIQAFRHDGYWSDIGSPRAYYEANFAMRNHRLFPCAAHNARVISHRIGSSDPTLAAYSALVTGKCRNCIVGDNAAIASDAVAEDCVVLPNVTVRGMHYGEIIGDGYALPLIADVVPNLHDSTQIYKNFS